MNIKKARELADKILLAPKHEQPGMAFWAICLSPLNTSKELVRILKIAGIDGCDNKEGKW